MFSWKLIPTTITILWVSYSYVATGRGYDVTRKGPLSDPVDDAKSNVTCPDGYIAEMCECSEASTCDGSYFIRIGSEDICIARNEKGIAGVKAKVSCVKLEEGNQKYRTRWSENSTMPHVSCPVGTVLRACMEHSPWRNHMNYTIDGNTCSMDAECYRYCRLQVRCRVLYCGDPGPLLHATRKGTYFYYRGKVRYLCEKGTYIMNDNRVQTRQVLRCDEHGNWNATLKACRRICYPDEAMCLRKWILTRRGVAVMDENSVTMTLTFLRCAASCRPSEGCISFTYNKINATCWLNQETIHPGGQYEQDPSVEYYEFHWP